MNEVMDQINKAEIKAPVHVGDIDVYKRQMEQ